MEAIKHTIEDARMGLEDMIRKAKAGSSERGALLAAWHHLVDAESLIDHGRIDPDLHRNAPS